MTAAPPSASPAKTDERRAGIRARVTDRPRTPGTHALPGDGRGFRAVAQADRA